MTIETTDIRSSPNEQILHCAKVIGKSKDRRKVFEEIHRGKKRIKTAKEIALKTGLKETRVLQEGRILTRSKIVNKSKVKGRMAYEKDDFYQQNRAIILRLAGNKSAIQKYPTKWNPISKVTSKTVKLTLSLSRNTIDIKRLTVDDIDTFGNIKNVKLSEEIKKDLMLEKDFKKGLQKILGEEGEFKDWGGETDDLYSTRLVINGKRFNVSFGLKGRGTTGKLVPKKMGKQGDQIQRLFSDPADVFLIQYCGQIDKSILVQMEAFAIAKSVLWKKRIYYGIVDEQDTLRLIEAYKECFEIDKLV